MIRTRHQFSPAVIIVSLAALPASIVLAQPPSTPQNRSVSVYLLAENELSSGIETSLSDSLKKLGFKPTFIKVVSLDEIPATPSAEFARVSVDSRSTPNTITILIVDPRSTLLLRRDLKRTGSQEVQQEQVSLIVQQALESAAVTQLSPTFSASATTSASTSAPTSAVASSSAPPISSQSKRNDSPPKSNSGDRSNKGNLSVDVGGYFSLQSLAPQVNATPGAALILRLGFARVWGSPFVGVLGRFNATSTYSSREIDVDIDSASLRLFAGLNPLRTDRVGITLGLGGGVDFFALQPTKKIAQPAPPSHHNSPVLTAFVGPEVYLTHALTLQAVGALDLDLKPARLILGPENPPVETTSFHRVRPTLFLGLSYRFGATP